ISGYDPRLMRRLLGYTKPYWPLVIGAVFSLIVATAGDLLVPVLIQRAVDEHLVARYTRIPNEFASRDELDSVDVSDAYELGNAVYVQDDELVALRGTVREDLVEQGIIEDKGYYVFPYDRAVINAFSGTFESRTVDVGSRQGTAYASINAEDFEELPVELRRLVRREDLEELQRTTVLFLILIGSVLVFTFTQIYLMALTGQGVMKDMRGELFNHTVNQRLSYHSSNPVGRLVTRVTNDIETVNQLFTEVLINLLRNIALMIGSLATLLLLNWRLGLVTLATLPPVLLLTVYFRGRAREAFRNVRVWVSRVNAFLSEHLSGMSVVQLFVRQQRAKDQFTEQNDTLMKANLGEMYVFAVFRPIIDLLSSASIAVVVYYGAGFLMSGLVSLGVLIAFVDLIRRFYRPVMQISEQFTILQSAMAGSERVFEMLDTVERIPDDGSHKPETRVTGRLEFDHVWFSYEPGEPVIKNLTLDIDAGETIAIVGYTGAGKTTIANLLTRLWDIQEGAIRLDGVDIREYRRDTLRTLVQPIQQDVFLFSDTIRNNIALGTELSDERIREVARMVQADTFINKLPHGYDTTLAEGATNISTGQRQLLSFARILAHDPRIIIMDEATSNIDTETEQLIQKAVEMVMQNRTALVIAHRLSTIKNADRIMVLSRGELVELGTHDELIDLRGIYFNLYRLQYQN
ncbi:MAG: ABC transporter ATP-binding protein, partial [Spirochaetales bacterium]